MWLAIMEIKLLFRDDSFFLNRFLSNKIYVKICMIFSNIGFNIDYYYL